MKILSVVNVLDSFHRGWLKVNLSGKGNVWLPYSTQLGFVQKNQLMVLDGHYRGHHLEYEDELKNILTGDLIQTNKQLEITYHKLLSTLALPNQKPFTLVDEALKILSVGRYKIEIPRFPHSQLCHKSYLNESLGGSRYAETWFEIIPCHGRRLGVFIHSGEISDGCLTVSIEKNRKNSWDKIYSCLISNRVDYKYVAELLVIN